MNYEFWYFTMLEMVISILISNLESFNNSRLFTGKSIILQVKVF